MENLKPTPGRYYLATCGGSDTYIMQLDKPGPRGDLYAIKYIYTKQIGTYAMKGGVFSRLEREATEDEIISWFGQKAYNNLVNNKTNNNYVNTKERETVQVCDTPSTNGEGKGCIQTRIQSRAGKVIITGYNPEYETGAVSGERKIGRD